MGTRLQRSILEIGANIYFTLKLHDSLSFWCWLGIFKIQLNKQVLIDFRIHFVKISVAEARDIWEKEEKDYFMLYKSLCLDYPDTYFSPSI